jgi:DNA polymerase III alpha subunit
MVKIKKLFIEGCKRMKIVSDEVAAQIFDWIEKSQRYSFNKSHAIGYGILGYVCAYAKYHFPLQFYTSCLLYAQAGSDATEKIQKLSDDAKLMDINLFPPDLTQLENNFHTDGKSIYFGLSDIKNVGLTALPKIQELLAEKNIDINTVPWYDFLIDVLDNLSITVVHRMIETGALERFSASGMSRKRMISEYDIWHSKLKDDTEKAWILERRGDFTDICTAMKAMARTRKEGGGCFSAPRVAIVQDLIKSLDNPPSPFEDSPDWIAWCEKEYLGISLTYSELDKYDVTKASHTCKDIVKGHKAYAVLAVQIKQVKTTKTKRGKSPGSTMAFLSASDKTCTLENIVVFSNTWKEFSHLLTENNAVFISGKMTREGSFQVEKVYPIED